jgi:TonB family protein
MKTKKTRNPKLILNLLFIIPALLLILVAVTSCSAGKKAAKIQTEAAPPPPPPPVPKPEIGQKEGDAYVMVDEMPKFPGGDGELLRFISVNTRYPKEAKDQNIQGRVIIRFKVNADGTVSDAKVLKGVNNYLDEEALRVVSSVPKFTPGKLNGVDVPVWYMIPITFTLGGDPAKRTSRFEIIDGDTVYLSTSSMPSFPGGSEALNSFKSKNIKFSTKVKSMGIEGTVLVRFIIEKDGSVTNIRVINGVSPVLDAEAIRVTKKMPRWQPGMEKMKPVRFLSMTNYDFLTTPKKPVIAEEGAPFVVVEEMPMFPGGDAELLAWIGKNTNYPENAKKNGIEGRVIVRFCVTDVGGIDRVSILKGVDTELDNEAVRVVKSLPAFKPGKQGGKPVNVWYMVPITFGLVKPAETSVPKTSVKPQPALPAGYDNPPVFRGGEKAMYKFINSKLVYPQSARESLVSGKVIVRFAIDALGSVGDVSVVNGINKELDAEAIRVIKLLPKWKPATLEGKPVKVGYTIPVTFKL